MEQLKTKITEIVKNQSTDRPPIDCDILTEDEIYDCISSAVRKKQARVNLLEYTEKLNQKPEPVKITSEILYSEFLNRYERTFSKRFKIDKYNENILETLCRYFANEPEFEQGDYSLNKSLLLVGGLGTGKTSMMKIFGVMLQEINMLQETAKKPFGIVSAQKLAQVYSTEGYPGIQKYTQPFNSTYSKEAGWCIDDLGAETTGKYYGKDSNVMQEILEAVYLDDKLKGAFHITSNFYAKKIEEFYGVRVRSRMREMYNLIDFGQDSPDRRK